MFLACYLVKWRSIKVSVRFLPINILRHVTFSSVRVVFGRSLPGFRSVADPRSSIRLQIAFGSLSKASNPFPEILQQLFSIQKQVSAMIPSVLYLRTIF